MAGIALGWWLKHHFRESVRQRNVAQEQAAQRWVGTWVGGEVEFDIAKEPSGNYTLHNRTFNFTCDVTLDGNHAHWQGPPGSWVMDADLSNDGKTAKAKGMDGQGSGLTKDFNFQKLPKKP